MNAYRLDQTGFFQIYFQILATRILGDSYFCSSCYSICGQELRLLSCMKLGIHQLLDTFSKIIQKGSTIALSQIFIIEIEISSQPCAFMHLESE